MPLLTATSAFGLGRRRWSSPQHCYLSQRNVSADGRKSLRTAYWVRRRGRRVGGDSQTDRQTDARRLFYVFCCVRAPSDIISIGLASCAAEITASIGLRNTSAATRLTARRPADSKTMENTSFWAPVHSCCMPDHLRLCL